MPVAWPVASFCFDLEMNHIEFTGQIEFAVCDSKIKVIHRATLCGPMACMAWEICGL